MELAPLTDPALVAAARGGQPWACATNPGRSILDSADAATCATAQVLLVLDNCEHLLEACAQLADALLRACPRLKILASSREPLGIAGEAVFRRAVAALPRPGPACRRSSSWPTTPPCACSSTGRAWCCPITSWPPHNAAALARICQRLDGIPLAIEMAAARMNLLSADQLADRLDDAFRLLTGGSRTALPRQQTLRATIDWSYELLSEPERLLLQRLSVFAGGCTLEAAEAVCAGRGPGSRRGAGRAGALVAKSMVTADRQPGETPATACWRRCASMPGKNWSRARLSNTGWAATWTTSSR